MRFRLTEDHLKLLRRANVTWEDAEYDGAPCIDLKRPYGNSYVAGDVAEILDRLRGKCETCGHEPSDQELTDKQVKELLAIHRETEHALSIVLQHGHRPGIYERGEYGRDWKQVDP
jgi:hypothetical protein